MIKTLLTVIGSVLLLTAAAVAPAGSPSAGAETGGGVCGVCWE
ncbi:hypothetical protein [Kribbella jejuensis]|nr:hypothetical protein [Kribbella jejuensis]